MTKEQYKKIVYVVLAVVGAAALYFTFTRQGETPSETQQNEGNAEISQDNPEDKKENGEEKTEQEEPFDESSIWSRLDDLASVCETYYEENYEKTRLISKDGYLYNKAADEAVTQELLLEREELTEQQMVPGAVILLLQPETLKEFGVTAKSEGLRPYVAYKNPEKDEYFITSMSGGTGTLSTENYENLLSMYRQNHGEIIRVTQEEAEYNAIIDSISQHTGDTTDKFIRYMVADEKYSCVIFSPTYDSNLIFQMILEKTDSWKVVMDGIEDELRVYVAVNQRVPGISLDLLPSYTIRDYKNQMITQFGPFLESLKSNDSSLADTDIAFASGIDKEFAFIKLNNGNKYLGVFKDETWAMHPVENFVAAEILMSANAKNPPYFIILQE